MFGPEGDLVINEESHTDASAVRRHPTLHIINMQSFGVLYCVAGILF